MLSGPRRRPCRGGRSPVRMQAEDRRRVSVRRGVRTTCSTMQALDQGTLGGSGCSERMRSRTSPRSSGSPTELGQPLWSDDIDLSMRSRIRNAPASRVRRCNLSDRNGQATCSPSGTRPNASAPRSTDGSHSRRPATDSHRIEPFMLYWAARASKSWNACSRELRLEPDGSCSGGSAPSATSRFRRRILPQRNWFLNNRSDDRGETRLAGSYAARAPGVSVSGEADRQTATPEVSEPPVRASAARLIPGTGSRLGCCTTTSNQC